MNRYSLTISIICLVIPTVCWAQLVQFNKTTAYRSSDVVSLTLVNTQPQNQSAVIVNVVSLGPELKLTPQSTTVLSGTLAKGITKPTLYYFQLTFSEMSRYYQMLVLPKSYTLSSGDASVSERIPIHIQATDDFGDLKKAYDDLHNSPESSLSSRITQVLGVTSLLDFPITPPPAGKSTAAAGLLVGYSTFVDNTGNRILVGGQYCINRNDLNSYYGNLLDSLQKIDQPSLYPILKVLAESPPRATFNAPKKPSPTPISPAKYPVFDWLIASEKRGFQLTILRNMSL